MEIKTGYLYHIKDEYFDKINQKELMINHKKGHSRPTYFTVKDGDILWFIPISSKVNKYKNIVENKIKKYSSCKTIMIRKILENDAVILIQNAFPTLEKYIDHVHIANGVPAKVSDSLKREIINNFKYALAMKQQGLNLFFTDIDKIKGKMLKELEKETK